ncbi:unnamed protein product, partial [Rotaria socialis]
LKTRNKVLFFRTSYKMLHPR